MTAAITGGGVDPAAGKSAIAQLAEQAAQAVRALNHLTRPGAGALTNPADAADLLAGLGCLTFSRLVRPARPGHRRRGGDRPPGPGGRLRATRRPRPAGRQQQLAHLAGTGGGDDQQDHRP